MVAELPPPSPEFSQAATFEAVRTGRLGASTYRSEGKHLKPGESFQLTLEVSEPSVLAYRWSSVTDGALSFSASFLAKQSTDAVMLAPLGPRKMERSGALDVGVGLATFGWENKSTLFVRAVSYCVMVCPNRELCDEQVQQAEASAREQHRAMCEAIVSRAVDVAVQAGSLRREAAASEHVAEEERTASLFEREEAAQAHEQLEELLACVEAQRARATSLLASAHRRIEVAEESEQRAESLRTTAEELLAAVAVEASTAGVELPAGSAGGDDFEIDTLAARRAEHKAVHDRSLQMD